MSQIFTYTSTETMEEFLARGGKIQVGKPQKTPKKTIRCREKGCISSELASAYEMRNVREAQQAKGEVTFGNKEKQTVADLSAIDPNLLKRLGIKS